MAPQVTAIRVGQRPVHTRVVIDTDGPATYTRTILDQPYRIVLDLPGATLAVAPGRQAVGAGPVREVRWAQYRPTVVRVVLELTVVQPDNVFTLAGPDRLVVDVYKPPYLGAVKYGGVASQPADLDENVDLLRRMGATTARVSLFWGNAQTRRYDDAQLDRLLGAGLTELILQSGETADAAQAAHQLGQLIGYIDAHPRTQFVFELGNEPDLAEGDLHAARVKRLTTLREVRPRFSRPNLLWAVNECSQNAEAGAFEAFNRDAHDGLGALLYSPAAGETHAPYAPDVVTVHCYGAATLCPARGQPGNPWKVLDWVRGWSTTVRLKVTEAGINNGALADRGQRYVEFVAQLEQLTGGQVDSVCYYALPRVNDRETAYNLSRAEAEQIGARRRSHHCP